MLPEATRGLVARELQILLNQLPSELEELYINLVRRIEIRYRLDTYSMLEIVLRAGGSLPLDQIWGAFRCAHIDDFVTCTRMVSESRHELESSLLDMVRRRVRHACGGLLEISEGKLDHVEDGNSSSGSQTVAFMHQTVKEFVAQPEFQSILMAPGPNVTDANGHSFLTRAFLVGFLSPVDHSIDSDRSVPRDFLRYSTMAEITTGRSECKLFDSLDDPEASPVYPSDFGHSVLEFAVATNLYLYLKFKADQDPSTIYRRRTNLLHVLVGVHLLDRFPSSARSVKILDLLIKPSADHSLKDKDQRPFARVIGSIYYLLEVRGYLLALPWEPLAEGFLEHGYDPNIDVHLSDLNTRTVGNRYR